MSEVMNIIGEVKGRSCLLMDDMVDTAGTLCRAAEALKKEGAVQVVAYCTHAVLSGGAVRRIARVGTRRTDRHRLDSACPKKARDATRSACWAAAS